MGTCQFCGRICSNEGNLKRHIKYCIKNPNKIVTKTSLMKEERNSRRDSNGKLKRKGFKLSEEHKNKIRESYHKWLEENRDAFLKYSKGQSNVCENFKNVLRQNNIDFVEEYMPYWKERLYRLDIAFPDEKIGIEINGSQHYTSSGELTKETLEKQKFFEDRGWKIIQVYYKDAIKEKPLCLNDILKLPIRDKEYIKEEFDTLEKLKKDKILKKEEVIKERALKHEQKEQKEKEIIINLIENSGIDFSKSGWSAKAKQYLKERNELWNVGIFRCIRKYVPEFLKREDVWKRKGSKI